MKAKAAYFQVFKMRKALKDKAKLAEKLKAQVPKVSDIIVTQKVDL